MRLNTHELEQMVIYANKQTDRKEIMHYYSYIIGVNGYESMEFQNPELIAKVTKIYNTLLQNRSFRKALGISN